MKNWPGSVLSLIVVAACIMLVLVTVIGTGNNSPRFASQPLESPIRPTIDARLDTSTPDLFIEKQKADATLAAEATAYFQAQPPQPTPGPIVGPTRLFDPLNRVSLDLPEGWYAVVPEDTPGMAGETVVANYDFVTAEKAPSEGITIHIGVGLLPDGKTFEEWVLERRKFEVSPDNGANGIVLTEIEPYTLAGLNGVVYYLKDVAGWAGKSIYLSSQDRQIMGIAIYPLNVSDQLMADVERVVSSIHFGRTISAGTPD